ncbi:adult cuticle protein 1-like [Episyrphus balteatus]|uniref:adult cuticle protein 1-like n=1 Tax=Episyrphus balteatus TaxID=286459 RepID=UPI00248534B9|nr:adult cuticle protein 1-like [Episyrphus balteatus]
MKFAIAAVVVLALTMGAQSSLIAGIPGLVSPLGSIDIAGPGQVLAQGPGILGLGLGLGGLPAAVNIAGSPLIAHGAIPAIAAGIHGVGATYVAQTRGAVHTAPLAGHIQSAASVNLAPAPGTI